MKNFLLISFFLQNLSASEMQEAIDFDRKFDSLRTISSNETSTIIFMTPDPIIDVTNAALNESEVIKQLELGFESDFVENILLSLAGEVIDLFIDRIMIIGVQDASNNTIDYYSVRGSTVLIINEANDMPHIVYSLLSDSERESLSVNRSLI